MALTGLQVQEDEIQHPSMVRGGESQSQAAVSKEAACACGSASPALIHSQPDVLGCERTDNG